MNYIFTYPGHTPFSKTVKMPDNFQPIVGQTISLHYVDSQGPVDELSEIVSVQYDLQLDGVSGLGHESSHHLRQAKAYVKLKVLQSRHKNPAPVMEVREEKQ